MNLLQKLVQRNLRYKHDISLSLLLIEYRDEVITQMIERCKGNKSKTARILRVHRHTVTRWLREHPYHGKVPLRKSGGKVK